MAVNIDGSGNAFILKKQLTLLIQRKPRQFGQAPVALVGVLCECPLPFALSLILALRGEQIDIGLVVALCRWCFAPWENQGTGTSGGCAEKLSTLDSVAQPHRASWVGVCRLVGIVTYRGRKLSELLAASWEGQLRVSAS